MKLIEATVAACFALGAGGMALAQTPPAVPGGRPAALTEALDPARTLQLAREADLSGDIYRAIAAYERVLAADPANVQAARGLRRLTAIVDLENAERVPATTFYGTFAGRYDTNAPFRDPDFLGLESGALAASLGVRDERTVGGQRIRTNALLYGDLHNRFDEGDLVFVGGDIGPVFKLDPTWRMRIGAGAGHALLDRVRYYTQGFGVASFENYDPTSPLRLVAVAAGGRDYGRSYPDRDGAFVDVGAGLAWTDQLASGDVLTVFPGYTFNGATGAFNRYHRLRAAASYLYPVHPRVLAGPGVALAPRFYAGSDPDEGSDRRDLLLQPGVRVVVPAFPVEHTSLSVEYLFERNWSTDGDKRYRNHRFSAVLGWAF